MHTRRHLRYKRFSFWHTQFFTIFKFNIQKRPWDATWMPRTIPTLNTSQLFTSTSFDERWIINNRRNDSYLICPCRMTRIVQTRQTRPWLQPDWLFRLFPMEAEQRRCISILHGFTDHVNNDTIKLFANHWELILVTDDSWTKNRTKTASKR